MKKSLILLVLITLISCNSKKEKKVEYSSKMEATSEVESSHPGKKILENKCFVCHNPSAKHTERIAPPMIAVKAHYIDAETTKEQFVNEFVAFAKKPSKQKAKMFGAVRKFGVMPYQPFKEEELKLIAQYVYDSKIEEPSWFKEHWEEKKGESYINKKKKQ